MSQRFCGAKEKLVYLDCPESHRKISGPMLVFLGFVAGFLGLRILEWMLK